MHKLGCKNKKATKDLKLRPEYLEKLKRIEKEGYGKTFKSSEQIKKSIGLIKKY